jgi:lactate dehydrogenase-like 2-hydroxyacid dehydrogenase
VEVQGFGRKNLDKLPASLKKAAWLILALPSDTGTDDFVNAKLIAKLPRNCVIINIGRGNAIDEPSLIKALETGRIAGAYLDVFHNEPGPLFKVGSAQKGGILTLPKRKLPWNLIRMPHSSAFCSEYLKMCFEELKNDGLI